MEFRWFGSLECQVPVIGQATWYQPEDNRRDAIDASRVDIDCGMTHIDTTEMYLSGEAEIGVGEAIKLPFCEQHRIAVVAYSPFGHGDFPDLRSTPGQARC